MPLTRNAQRITATPPAPRPQVWSFVSCAGWYRLRAEGLIILRPARLPVSSCFTGGPEKRDSAPCITPPCLPLAVPMAWMRMRLPPSGV